jgi:hypothetical protein
LRFYVEQLGFNLVVDHRFESGERWIEVAPPDGSANLALVAPEPDTDAFKLIGGRTPPDRCRYGNIANCLAKPF